MNKSKRSQLSSNKTNTLVKTEKMFVNKAGAEAIFKRRGNR